LNDLPSYSIYSIPDIRQSSLLVCWDMDAGGIGPSVFDYLSQNVRLEEFGEIEPRDYFTLGGVLVQDDVALFPRIRLYHVERTELVVMYSALPRFEWYRYLCTVFEVADKICKVREVYTLGGLVSVSAHTAPRALTASLNSHEIRKKLSPYDISVNLDYSTPVGQRPTMSSYLSWEAGRRGIPGISIWVPVPFYLVGIEDLRGSRKILEFLARRFELILDFKAMDEDISRQNIRINSIVQRYPELVAAVRKLESNNALSDVESGRLLEIMGEELKQPGY
jgi:predicted ATP-grasp superfamily ATP-dependent carboligase